MIIKFKKLNNKFNFIFSFKIKKLKIVFNFGLRGLKLKTNNYIKI